MIYSIMFLVGLALEPGDGWRLLAQHTGSCQGLQAYYLDDWASDGGSTADIRLMGEVRGNGERGLARAALVMENGRTSMVIVRVRAGEEAEEITPMEFRGRWPSPCHLLGPRGPE